MSRSKPKSDRVPGKYEHELVLDVNIEDCKPRLTIFGNVPFELSKELEDSIIKTAWIQGFNLGQHVTEIMMKKHCGIRVTSYVAFGNVIVEFMI